MELNIHGVIKTLSEQAEAHNSLAGKWQKNNYTNPCHHKISGVSK